MPLHVWIFILFFTSCSANNGNNWSWSWGCVNERCLRLEPPVVGNLSKNTFQSLAACRLICGPYGAIWPLPTIHTSLSRTLVPFHPRLIKFEFPVDTHPNIVMFMMNTKAIFEHNLYKECGTHCNLSPNTEVKIHIITSSKEIEIVPKMDESYDFTVNHTTTDDNGSILNVLIEAPTVFGARHALETLSQLVTKYSDDVVNPKADTALLMVSNAKVIDKPVFKHRGLLLDTARNYLSVSTILRQIDGMAVSKMNVFHWHATDSQSFPLETPSAPNMSIYGAYSRDQTYREEDVLMIKKYANQRGIRLMMEIDAPSHAGNGWQWGEEAGLGNLAVCVNQNPWRDFCIQPPCGQLNPINANTYAVLESIYKDLQKFITPGEHFHMGADEVFLDCWNNTKEIVDTMLSEGFGRTNEDFLKLWSLFQSEALKRYDRTSHNITSVVLWTSQLTEPDSILEYLPNKDRYIIQTWVPATSPIPQQLIELGYRVIMSTKDAWYLDHGLGHGSNTFHTWRVMYNNQIPTASQVLGGEACMWGELISDGAIDARVWPRTAAVAERLWSDPQTSSLEAEARFYRHRDRLVTRGITADMPAPRWCLQNEGEC